MYQKGKRNFTAKIQYQKGVLDGAQKCHLMDTLETEFFAIDKYLSDNHEWLPAEDWRNCITRMSNVLSGYEMLWADVFDANDPVINAKWENMVMRLHIHGDLHGCYAKRKW